MRAVNLIPADLRRGGGAGAGGRSGGAVYVLLAALAALAGMAAIYGVTAHKVSQRQSQIVTATRDAAVAQARAAALDPYVQVQAARAKRISLVSSLVQKRFDWSVAMRQIAEALPADATLTAMTGTDTPSSNTGSGGGAASGAGSAGALRGLLPVPAVELAGCSPTQPRVAAALTSLRNIPGVDVVSLGSSSKGAAASGASASSSPGGGACDKGASFSVIVFYTNPTAPQAPQASTVTPAAAKSGVGR